MRVSIFIFMLLIAGVGAAWWLFRADPPPVEAAAAASPVAPSAEIPPAPPTSTATERVVAEPAGRLKIDVIVSDPVTGQRVIGCTIELWKRVPGARAPAPLEVKVATAISRAVGAMRFTELAYGSYLVRVHDDAFVGDDVAIELSGRSPSGQASVLARKRP